MNLIIDQGNTRTKYAVFDKKNLVLEQAYSNYENQEIALKQIMKDVPLQNVIVSSVTGDIERFQKIFRRGMQIFILDHETPIPVVNKYQSPQTLGKDRIALAVAANDMFKNQNVLIIDAGTCITYDLINNKNEYLGGAISPGLEMRFKALHQFTAALPLVEKIEPMGLIGTDTLSAIQSGVVNGTLAEIEQIIYQYKQLFSELQVILSGGDSIFFDKKLKNNIFAISNILLYGLNIILQYNVQEN